MANEYPHLVWVDCEMTGLDISQDALVEIAVLVTDAQLNVLGEGVDLVIKCDQAKLDSMADVVRDMHSKSGLINEIANGTTLEKADEAIIAYLKRYAPLQLRTSKSGPSAANVAGLNSSAISTTGLATRRISLFVIIFICRFNP